MEQAKLHIRAVPEIPPRLKFISRLVGYTAMLVGILVIVGWLLSIELLKSVLPGLPTMNILTAIALVLAGVSLRLLMVETRGQKTLRTAQACASLVLFIGLFKLFGIFSGWNSSLAQLLLDEDLSTAGSAIPSFAKPNTAAGLVLVGVLLLLLDSRGKVGVWVFRVFFFLLSILSLIAIIGYIYDAESFQGIGDYVSMALHTALILYLLSVGIFCARPERGLIRLIASDSSAGSLIRVLLPAAVFIPITLGWLRLQGERAGLYDADLGVGLFVIANMAIFVALVLWSTRLLYNADAERERSEEELRESEQRLRTIVESAPVVLFVIDQDYKITLSEGRGLEPLGVNSGELAGQSVIELYGEALPNIKSDLDRVFYDGETVSTIVDLGRVVYETQYAPLRNTEGEVSGIIGISVDVTERQQAEKELQDMAAFPRLNPAPVVKLNREALIVSANEAALENGDYEAVLMDCQMPHMDGYEATAEIRRRESEHGGHIPIITMTANAMQGDREKALSAGMDDYISKPVKAASIAEVLERWLPQHQEPSPTNNVVHHTGKDKDILDTEVLSTLRGLQLEGADILSKLVRLFIEDATDKLQDLEEAVNSEDSVGVYRLTHDLKGSSGSLGANRMYRVCLALGEATQADDSGRLRELLADLNQEFENARSKLEDELITDQRNM